MTKKQKIISFLKERKSSLFEDIYFIPYKGFDGFIEIVMFMGEGIVYLVAFYLYFAIFVWSMTFILWICLALIGLRNYDDDIFFIGLLIPFIFAMPFTILPFAKRNVHSYKEAERLVICDVEKYKKQLLGSTQNENDILADINKEVANLEELNVHKKLSILKEKKLEMLRELLREFEKNKEQNK
ncbi:MAG: hypothetical protein JW787_02840 [Sedimentisphaerales bacterium]|nr:hypothetical protein [Sedimentisphaerales bacterium]